MLVQLILSNMAAMLNMTNFANGFSFPLYVLFCISLLNQHLATNTPQAYDGMLVAIRFKKIEIGAHFDSSSGDLTSVFSTDDGRAWLEVILVMKNGHSLTVMQLNDSHTCLDLNQEVFWLGGQAVYRLSGSITVR